MKKLLIVLVGSLIAYSAFAADSRATVVDQEITQLAKVLQSRLPSLSMDGMVEAEREAHGWNFGIRVRSDAGGADEVQIIVREAPDKRSELRVQGVHIDSNLLTSKRGVNAELTAQWKERVLKLVEDAS
jgi:hypothetical protein